MKHHRPFLFALAAVSLGMLWSGPVAAEADVEGSTSFEGPHIEYETIKTSQFDLTTLEGLTGIHRRIASTTAQICSSALHGVSSDMQLYRACIDHIVDYTVRGTNHSALIAFHDALPAEKRGLIWKDAPENWSPDVG